MFVAAFLTFMAIGGFPSFVEDMKVSLSYQTTVQFHGVKFTINHFGYNYINCDYKDSCFSYIIFLEF